ncbi:hypothetical protein KIL84_017667 [Mauremys mutica]|uniref:BEN domain-containing protein n=1 Tax=Mauremys mutica TaxID=74926 RepID=A0A9D3X6L3_9SAUR|nr:hypothetical protein KIL84_017667 [Mauremys mutica]
MKKFTLFDFVNDNSLQIGETSWIQDLPNDGSELEGLLKPNEQVLVNWPVGERKTEKHLVKVVYMSDDPQELVEMMQKILQADEITKIQVVGKGKRKRIEMIFSESEDSDLDKGQAVTHFEELVGMAEALLKGGVTTSASSIHSHTVWKASNSSLSDSYATIHSNSNSPIALNMEEEEQQPEKQFKVEKWQIALCNKSKPQKFINDLMQALYTHEYMATHSLTGAKSSSSKDKAAKPAMNQNEVQEIIGITKQLFPNTDDALIRRMMGQKLNNCTKKPILSKDLNAVVFQKHSFCGSPAPPPSTQDTIPLAPVSSVQDQQDDDSPAPPTPVQHGDSSLASPPPSTQAQQGGVTPTSSSMESQGRNSPAPTPNQGCRQDFRSSDKK